MMLIKLNKALLIVIGSLSVSMLSFNTFAQPVRVEVEDAINDCKQAAVFNNSNKNYRVYIDYEYKGQGGSYQTGRTEVVSYAGQKTSSSWFYSGPVDCRKPYRVRITNYQWR